MIAGIVLAAGHADRMGSNKLVLPLGRGTVVGKVLATALASCDSVFVVTGLHDQGTKTAVEQAAISLGASDRVEVVAGVPYDPGMFISVQAGLRRVGTVDAVLIFPGDIPLMSPATAMLVRDAVLRGGPTVAVPVHDGHRGHPVAFAACCIRELLAMSEHSTLRHYIEAHPAEVILVPVDDREMLLDMDTPDDYDRVVEHLESGSAQSKEV
ncbi:nucleotidyltransferase family protein [bacterium]|nr:nucleotidyltransferase family protein [bacterium]